MNVQHPRSSENESLIGVEEIVATIEDDQTIGGFRFKGCQQLARDLIEIESIPDNLLTCRGLGFNQNLDMLLLDNEDGSSRGRSFEFPGGKVFDNPEAYEGFAHYDLKRKVTSVLANFLNEMEEETSLILRESAYTYEGWSDAPFSDPPYYFKSDRSFKTKPLQNRTVLWFSGVLPPLYKERLRPGTTIDSEGQKEDEHDGFEVAEATDYDYYLPLLDSNSHLPEFIKAKIVTIARQAVKGQVKRVIDGDFQDKTSLSITSNEAIKWEEIRELLESVPHYCSTGDLEDFEVDKMHEVSLRAFQCVREIWNISIPERVTATFNQIRNVNDLKLFVGGRPRLRKKPIKLNEAELKAVRFIMVAMSIYGTLASKGFLRDDLDEVADKCRDEYLKIFNFQGSIPRVSKSRKKKDGKSDSQSKTKKAQTSILQPLPKDKKEQSDPLWANYDKYKFVAQDGMIHTVFVRRNAKTEDRIVNKYLSKPSLNIGKDIKDLIGLRFVFEDSIGVNAFSDWLAKENILQTLGMREDTEVGTSIEASPRSEKGERKYIGLYDNLPCEVQIIPRSLHEEDETGLLHHSNFSGKQFAQGGLRIDNHEGFSETQIREKIKETAKTTKRKVNDVWADWRNSIFKTSDERWHSFEAVLSAMNISGMRENQDDIIKAAFAELGKKCNLREGEMTLNDWYHIFNSPGTFVENKMNHNRARKILDGLQSVKMSKKRNLLSELEAYFSQIDKN